MFLLWPKQLPRYGIGHLLQFPHPLKAGPVLLTLLCLQLTKFCMVLYNLFQWSGNPACPWMVFCKHVCVWRYIPDVSVGRDVFHIHLLLCHPILSEIAIFKETQFATCSTFSVKLLSRRRTSWWNGSPPTPLPLATRAPAMHRIFTTVVKETLKSFSFQVHLQIGHDFSRLFHQQMIKMQI